MNKMDSDINESVLEADSVYLLMKKDMQISRTTRLNWFLDNINQTVKLPVLNKDWHWYDSDNKLELISVVPFDLSTSGWLPELNHMYKYKVTNRTKAWFLAHRYRLTICLDMSPSMSTVDIQRGEIILDEMFLCFKKSLESLAQPFLVPGSCITIEPSVYLTIIAHTPFFTTPAQQVLIKGVRLSQKNIHAVLKMVEKQLQVLEEKISQVTAKAHEQIDLQRIELDRQNPLEEMFEDDSVSSDIASSHVNIAMVSPDASFINMLRYSMLALSLLPDISLGNILIITDGVVCMPAVNILESLLQQLHYDSTCVSFIMVGGSYHPHCSFGYVSYKDILYFIAKATLGIYIDNYHESDLIFSSTSNAYLKSLLLWTFNSKSHQNVTSLCLNPEQWNTTNSSFHGNKTPPLLLKKQSDEKANVSLVVLLSRRLREGYTLDNLTCENGKLDISLSLPWKTHTYLLYSIILQWPIRQQVVQIQISIKAPYENLHDTTCPLKKQLKSAYRQAVVETFWSTISQLVSADSSIAQHLSSFSNTSTWYTLPEGVRCGMPVFVMLPNIPFDAIKPQFTPNDMACPKFSSFWQPICHLENTHWRKWFHIHRIFIILHHDHPLPRHLQLANPSGRFTMIQCRQAAAALYGMLSEWASFVLIDNHSYIKFVSRPGEKSPTWFCIVRVTSKLPCAVLNIGFMNDTPGEIRKELIENLRIVLSQLTYSVRSSASKGDKQLLENKENICCTVLNKPLEKILIRYERMPSDLTTIVFPDGTQPNPSYNSYLSSICSNMLPRSHLSVSFSANPLYATATSSALLTTLSRYLHHRRWVWGVSCPINPKLGVAALDRILSTITKMRLKEGFTIAHSSAGIINMILEVEMVDPILSDGKKENNVTFANEDSKSLRCIIQYILFPPHSAVNRIVDHSHDFMSNSSESDIGEVEMETIAEELQLVTEVWIEPQYGRVTKCPPERCYMAGQAYQHIADAICEVDSNCISSLLTLEHLSILCQEMQKYTSPEENIPTSQQSDPFLKQTYMDTNEDIKRRKIEMLEELNFLRENTRIINAPNECDAAIPLIEERIHKIPFSFNLINILPKCRQAQLLFSLFGEDNRNKNVSKSPNILLLDSMYNHMKKLHDFELCLNKSDSQQLLQILLQRQKSNFGTTGRQWCHKIYEEINSLLVYPIWRCFVKGFSVTHVMLTFVPYHLTDLKLLYSPQLESIPNVHEYQKYKYMSDEENGFSTDSSLQKLFSCANHKPKRPTELFSMKCEQHESKKMENFNTIDFPIFVYDCPLSVLMNAFVHPNHEKNHVKSDTCFDIFQDHTNKSESIINETSNDSKKVNDSLSPVSDIYSEDSEETEDRACLKQHCQILSRAHAKCFVLALFRSLHRKYPVRRVDVQSAINLCESTVIHIDISEYIKTVCGHVRNKKEIDIKRLLHSSPCVELRYVHHMIKKKFAKSVQDIFQPVPSHENFYYFSPNINLERMTDITESDIDSNDDDVIDESTNDLHTPSLDNITRLFYNIEPEEKALIEEQSTPLFLHFTCSINGYGSVPVKVLPTCLEELFRHLNCSKSTIDLANLKITLDITLSTLAKDIQDLIMDTQQSMRSYCSLSSLQQSGISSNLSSESNIAEIIDNSTLSLELLPYQNSLILFLKNEIKWQLRDEIVTLLLDSNFISIDILDNVKDHVSCSLNRQSCHRDVVSLNFVYGPSESMGRFLEEFSKLPVNDYKLCKVDLLYYLAKDYPSVNSLVDLKCKKLNSNSPESNVTFQDGINRDTNQENYFKNNRTLHTSAITEVENIIRDLLKAVDTCIAQKQVKLGEMSKVTTKNTNSEIVVNEKLIDVGEFYEDTDWLLDLDRQRPILPNFWMIMNVDNEAVTVYFHCRFLELETTRVSAYLAVQRSVISAIKHLCKQVNQFLLLQFLDTTKTCDKLLEPEEVNRDIWNSQNNTPVITRNTSQVRLKSMDDSITNENPDINGQAAYVEASLKFMPGFFACAVIWETHFILHPRLKTGSVRPGLSRGIHALRTVLNKFSVNNRNNMFVYRDSSMNVFYLRLYENVNTGIKSLNPSQDDNTHALVVRSPSIASLPLRPQRHTLAQADFNSSKTIDIRPRVRSFGEKESQDAAAGNTSGLPPEDTITLKVHGVTAVGRDVMCDLVQVLQNRLDDAVLELLSLMLARNPMCKLTPDDVHFLQKPFRPPENTIRLSSKYSVKCLDSFQYYLQQNLLQFLHIPKYTDTGGHYHFRDYSEGEPTIKRNPEKNIYLYNQSPSSGSRGIACIAIAVTQNVTVDDVSITEIPTKKDQFDEIVSSNVFKSHCITSPTLIEFRIWQKGRVNIEVLTSRLRSAVSYSIWDLVMEHKLLLEPLCVHPTNFDLGSNEARDILKPSNQIGKKDGTSQLGKSVSNLTAKPNKLKMEYQTHSLDSNSRNQSMDTSLSDSELQNKSSSLCEININLKEEQLGYQIGELGILHEIYANVMKDWLEFACDIKVPSVTKYKVTLTNQHPLDTTIVELKRLIKVQNSDIILKAFSALDLIKSGYVYIPYDSKKPSSHCLLLGRNFEQWWANCIPDKYNSEFLEPKSNKVLQKFSPLLIDSANRKFVPRQRLLLISLNSSEIILYTYNWSKDRLEKIFSQIENLGSWLSVRASVLISVTAQKMGLFHNQPLFRKSLTTNNIYVVNATEPDHLVRFSSVGPTSQLKEWSSKRQTSNATSYQVNVEEVFRDVPMGVIKEKVNYSSDPIIRCTQEIQQLRLHYKRTADEQKRVYSIWQARWVTNQIQLQSHMVQLLCQQSRIIHYCHTPLLFLSRWRVQAAATRDHSLISVEDNSAVNNSNLDPWHNRLCIGFFEEYKQYLQTLGFSPIQIVTSSPGNANTKSENSSPPKPNTPSDLKNDNFDLPTTCYLQRSMLGGILLFELLLTEPFFITKLHALECYRIQNKTSRQSINQFTLSFLDECDKIKVLMHLHSFTYDFHLRCIYRYLSESSDISVRVCQGYHLIHFLDDFMKYYSKAPNFARNLVYAETISVDKLRTPPKDLYIYLLSHQKHYNMNVVSMNGDEVFSDAANSEFVLVQVTSSPQITYKDSQDRHHTDDFDLTLIVSYVEPECELYINDHTIYLKYYIILTSRSEIYPKSEVERTLGKFRTVTWTACFSENYSKIRYTSLNDSEVTTSVVQEIIEETADDDKTETKMTLSFTDSQATDIFENDQTNSTCSECMGPTGETEISSKENSEIPTQTHSHIEIRQESVNYLGYYSSHEQLMQQLILDRAKLAREQITEMVTQGMTHCKTHLLWNKLVSKSEANQLTYDEFMELRKLTKLTKISDIEPQLACILHNQPISWFHQFTKIILAKYLDQHRMYISSDGKVQHIVILHPRYLGAFMMVSIDSTMDNGELYAAYREPMRLEPSDMCEDDCKSFIEDFINCICFQIWVGMA